MEANAKNEGGRTPKSGTRLYAEGGGTGAADADALCPQEPIEPFVGAPLGDFGERVALPVIE
jgi:hypothetical protein